jgi:hypothetical protein
VGFGFWSRYLLDWNDCPLCNKETLFDVINWLDQKERTALPNVNVHSVDSMAELKRNNYEPVEAEKYLQEWNNKYQYVPGLQHGDPGDLVVMYMNKSTRWKNHASSPPSIFEERKWILVPFDFVGAGSSHSAKHVRRQVADESECAERVSLDELKSRLRKTFDYLQKNNRPHWQTVVAENEAFLSSNEK